ncbi:MAG: hypothetical protein ACQEUZ_15610 [Pseudomonadota bacterium]
MRREPHDPTRVLRFVARHALNGIIAGWVCMLLLLWLDIGGLGALIAASPSEELATAMMAGAFGVTFGMLGIAWGVLVVLPRDGD